MISIGQKSCMEAINPIMIVSRIATVCTLIRNPEKTAYITSKSLILLQIITVIVSMVHLAFVPYAIIYLEQMPQHSPNGTESGGNLSSQKFITKMANIILISLIAVLVRISNLTQMHKKLPCIMDNLKNFDRLIVSHYWNNDYLWILSLTAILILASWPYQFYSILVVTTESWMAFLMFYLNLYNNFSVVCCEFQFVSLCWIIQSRIKDITSRLEAMTEKELIENVDVTLGKLSRIKKATKLLTDSVSKLDDLFGFQLFVILSGLTLNTLFGFYFSIYGGFTKNSDKMNLNFQKISNLVNDLIWSLYYLVRFMFVCKVAGTLTEKVNSIKLFISNVINKSSEEEVKQELWNLLAHVTVHKLQFSACGFFKINTALITSAVSMGTTYLVILAQFQNKQN